MARERGWLERWEGFAAGVLVGVALVLVAMEAWHEARGLVRIGIWRRHFDRRHHREVAREMVRQVEAARAALEDGSPLALSEDLAGPVLQVLYAHQMELGRHLLAAGEVERFNAARAAAPWLLWDLEGVDLAGGTLRGARLAGAALRHADLSRCDLTEADLSGADLSGADLTGAVLDRANLMGARLDGARLVGARGSGARLDSASLVNAVLARAGPFDGSSLVRSDLSGASLWRCRLGAADLRHASLVGATLVEADLSLADLRAANLAASTLGGARLAGARVDGAWLVGAQGLSPATAAALRRGGAVLSLDEGLDRLDPRVAEGFRAQLAARAGLDAAERRAALAEMVRAEIAALAVP